MKTTSQISSNLRLNSELGTPVELSKGGGSSINQDYSLSSNVLAAPATGDFGNMNENQTWSLKYRVKVESNKVGGSFDRINMSGVLTYNDGTEDQQIAYDLGQVLVYLQEAGSTQFQEKAPR